MTEIVLITDIYKLREQKEKELKFYRDQLQKLMIKLDLVQREVNLTNHIIDLIQQEKVESLSKLIADKRS